MSIMILMSMVSSSSIQALLQAAFIFFFVYFYNLHSSLDCNTAIPLNTVCVQCLPYFFFLQACISSANCWWFFIALRSWVSLCASPNTSLCLCSSALCHVTSSEAVTPCLCSSLPCHYSGIVNISYYTKWLLVTTGCIKIAVNPHDYVKISKSKIN